MASGFTKLGCSGSLRNLLVSLFSAKDVIALGSP